MKTTIGKMAVGLALLLAGAAYIAPVLDNDTGESMQRVAAPHAPKMAVPIAAHGDTLRAPDEVGGKDTVGARRDAPAAPPRRQRMKL
jgi:hypothetical protein